MWVEKRDCRFLAAGLLTWTVGMYVFLEVAPAILIIPAIWILDRLPIRLVPLVCVGGLTFVVWYPFLSFEKTVILST